MLMPILRALPTPYREGVDTNAERGTVKSSNPKRTSGRAGETMRIDDRSTGPSHTRFQLSPTPGHWPPTRSPRLIPLCASFHLGTFKRTKTDVGIGGTVRSRVRWGAGPVKGVRWWSWQKYHSIPSRARPAVGPSPPDRDRSGYPCRVAEPSSAPTVSRPEGTEPETISSPPPGSSRPPSDGRPSPRPTLRRNLGRTAIRGCDRQLPADWELGERGEAHPDVVWRESGSGHEKPSVWPWLVI